MGTLIEVRVPDLPPDAAAVAVARVRRRLDRMEAALTVFDPASPLEHLNRSRPGVWIDLGEDLTDALTAALEGAAQWPGAYDPSLGAVMRRSGLRSLDPAQAEAGLEARLRNRPGCEALEVDTANRRACRRHSELEIDLGGIGKGLAAEAALEILHGAGSRAALVNHGGSLAALGPPPGSPKGWPVGIVHPRAPGEIWSEVRLATGYLATSGDYERWMPTASGRCHHLLDPSTGRSARGTASVTVWSRSGRGADTASTALFVRPAAAAARGSVDALVLFDREGDLVEGRWGAFAPSEPRLGG